MDAAAKREITCFGRTWNSYFVWIYSGVVVGTGVLFALASTAPVSISVLATIVGLVAMLSFALFKSTKLLRRSYSLLNWAKKGVYHFQIVALIFTVALLLLLREPVFAYLDILVVALLVYQAFGRVGCFMAGCCHGRPSGWGVRYGSRHAATGYFYFVRGVRLFPVQLVEATWLFMLAGLAIATHILHHAPGENVALYIVGYGAGRFSFEFLRGDPGRYFVYAFSEPQLTAVLLTAAVIALELIGVLPFGWWHVVVLLIMIAGMVGRVVYTKGLRSVRVERQIQPEGRRELDETVHSVLIQANLIPMDAGRHQGRRAFFEGVYLPRRRA